MKLNLLKKLTVLLAIYFISVANLSAQNKKNQILPFDTTLTSSTIPKKWADIQVQEINSTEMQTLLQKDKSKLKWIGIYSSSCSGTRYLLEYYLQMKKKYPDNVALFLISSDNYKDIIHLKKTLYRYKIFEQTYILDATYGSPKDDRERGRKFRNEMSTECEKDELGVPYHMVYNSKLKLLFHGYPNFGNDYPSDIISYFIK
jgi:hypothetical protein